MPGASSDDIHSLYATGFFLNIRVGADPTPKGYVVTYIVQAKPRLAAINFTGNKKYKRLQALEEAHLQGRGTLG